MRGNMVQFNLVGEKGCRKKWGHEDQRPSWFPREQPFQGPGHRSTGTSSAGLYANYFLVASYINFCKYIISHIHV